MSSTTPSRDVRVVGTVTRCRDCPNQRYYSGGYYVCDKMQGDTYIPDRDSIPGFCPLERAPDAAPAGDIGGIRLVVDPTMKPGEWEMRAAPAGEPALCANCSKPDVQIWLYPEEGEGFCSQECYDQHDELGCPHEHHDGYRHPVEARRLIDCEAVLRSLACWLGAGGYNAPTVDAKVFEDKIRWGVENACKEAVALATPTRGAADERAMMQFKLIDAAKALQHAAERATPEVAPLYKARAAEVFDIVSALATGAAGEGGERKDG